MKKATLRKIQFVCLSGMTLGLILIGIGVVGITLVEFNTGFSTVLGQVPIYGSFIMAGILVSIVSFLPEMAVSRALIFQEDD